VGHRHASASGAKPTSRAGLMMSLFRVKRESDFRIVRLPFDPTATSARTSCCSGETGFPALSKRSSKAHDPVLAGEGRGEPCGGGNFSEC